MKLSSLRRSARFLLVLSASALSATRAHAGSFPYWGVSFGTAEKTAAHLGLSFGRDIPAQSEGFSLGTGPVIEATVGLGAGKLGVGRSILIFTEEHGPRVFADLKAVATRTWDRPRGASPHATYLGLDGGLSIAFVRVIVGLSKRVENKARGADYLFTWGAGFQIRMGRGPRAAS